MNKELKKIEVNSKIEDIIVKEGVLEIQLESISIKIDSFHQQDCCEYVYADFSSMPFFRDQLITKDVSHIVIKSVEGMGFLLCFLERYDTDLKVFIPCYNHQNGCYSSDLTLIIHDGMSKTEIDISHLVEDDIV